jgi:hypothetical protein
LGGGYGAPAIAVGTDGEGIKPFGSELAPPASGLGGMLKVGPLGIKPGGGALVDGGGAFVGGYEPGDGINPGGGAVEPGLELGTDDPGIVGCGMEPAGGAPEP